MIHKLWEVYIDDLEYVVFAVSPHQAERIIQARFLADRGHSHTAYAYPAPNEVIVMKKVMPRDVRDR